MKVVDLRNKNLDLYIVRRAVRNRFSQLRKESSLKTKPEQNKYDNFHFALAEYLYKELKKNKVEVKKMNDLAVRIHIGEPELYKYHSLVIDCLDGNLYLINSKNNPKKIGKLSKFEGMRASDAFNCMKRSIYKILRKLNVYSIDHQGNKIEKLAKLSHVKDMRRTAMKTIDLRKKTAIIDLRKTKDNFSISKFAKTLYNKVKEIFK